MLLLLERTPFLSYSGRHGAAPAQAGCLSLENHLEVRIFPDEVISLDFLNCSHGKGLEKAEALDSKLSVGKEPASTPTLGLILGPFYS